MGDEDYEVGCESNRVVGRIESFCDLVEDVYPKEISQTARLTRENYSLDDKQWEDLQNHFRDFSNN